MNFYHKLLLKQQERTKRKLVFVVKTGELTLKKETDIKYGDINIDQIFYADGQF